MGDTDGGGHPRGMEVPPVGAEVSPVRGHRYHMGTWRRHLRAQGCHPWDVELSPRQTWSYPPRTQVPPMCVEVSPVGCGGVTRGHRDVTRGDTETSNMDTEMSPIRTRRYHVWGRRDVTHGPSTADQCTQYSPTMGTGGTP